MKRKRTMIGSIAIVIEMRLKRRAYLSCMQRVFYWFEEGNVWLEFEFEFDADGDVVVVGMGEAEFEVELDGELEEERLFWDAAPLEVPDDLVRKKFFSLS